MGPRFRLYLCAVVIVLSSLFAVLVNKDRELAETVAIGYIAVVITLLFLLNVWKKP